MKKTITALAMAGTILYSGASFGASDKEDVLKTKDGILKMEFLGHASLLFRINDKVIYIDPSSAYAKFEGLPKADLILITHEHFDHLDPKTLPLLRKESTVVVAPASCMAASPTIVMKNGETNIADGITIEAVPAYNLVHKNPQGAFFHPKGSGNGYVLTIGGKRIYVAGDTENIPEMKQLKKIDVAFLPYNLPYTMDADMFVDAAKMVKPLVLYPYHYNKSDLQLVKTRLKAEKGIDVRIVNFYHQD